MGTTSSISGWPHTSAVETKPARDALARAHQTFLTQGDTLRAARCAIWLIFPNCTDAA